MPLMAFDENGTPHYWHEYEAIKGRDFYCPDPACTSRRMRIRRRPEYVDHFFHLANPDSCAYGTGESREHLNAKATIATVLILAGYETSVEVTGPRRRIDVTAAKGGRRWAIEVAHSEKDAEHARGKESLDLAAGYEGTIWIATSADHPLTDYWLDGVTLRNGKYAEPWTLPLGRPVSEQFEAMAARERSLQGDIAALTEDVKMLNADLHVEMSRSTSALRLKNALRSAEDRAQDWEDRYRTLTRELDGKHLDAMRQEVDSLRERKEAALAELGRLRAEAEDARATVAEAAAAWHADLTEREAKVPPMVTAYERLERWVVALQDELPGERVRALAERLNAEDQALRSPLEDLLAPFLLT